MSTKNWKPKVSFPLTTVGRVHYFDNYKKSLEFPYFSELIRFYILILTHYDNL